MPPPDSRELTSILEGCLQTRLGPGTTISHLARRASPYSSSFAIEDLDAHLSDGSGLRLVFKNLGADAMLPDARWAKPGFLRDSQREIDVYREVLDAVDVSHEVLPPSWTLPLTPQRGDTHKAGGIAPHPLSASPGIRVPRFYGAIADQAAGRFWLFLERVEGSPLSQVGDWGIWVQAARWLAHMHAQLSADPARWPDRAIRYDACFYRIWPARARQAVGPEASELLGSLLAAHERVVNRLLSMEPSLIHGELYPSNVLVAGNRICPIDWEMAAVAPRLIDLAALSTGWTEAERTALACAYRDAAQELGEAVPSDGHLFEDLACCRLHLALQWLGWSTSWEPPPDQAHDWLGEALRAAALLGLT